MIVEFVSSPGQKYLLVSVYVTSKPRVSLLNPERSAASTEQTKYGDALCSLLHFSIIHFRTCFSLPRDLGLLLLVKVKRLDLTVAMLITV